MKITKRINALSESVTIAISTLAGELKASGQDILSFSAGEPDFDTPDVIKDEAIKALNNGATKYTAVGGIPELKIAIAEKLKVENNLIYDPSNIVVNVGAKHSLFNIFQALIEEGDEVIIPAPYWVTYPELVVFSGAKPVIIKTDETNNFKITATQLLDSITPQTKMLVLTTPSNPTGSIYSKSELEEIAEVLKGTDIVVISDEMYEKLIYDNLKFTSVASINEDMFERTITVNGLSKSVAMTGWRFGYMASPNKDLINAVIKLQSQSTSNINSITQYASKIVFEGKADSDIEKMRVEFEKRRNIALELFNTIDGLTIVKPNGAFYLYINISKIETDSMKFSKALLKEQGVAIVPGIAFGLDGYFRFSFATDEDTIKEGIERIRNFIKNY